MPIVVVCIIVQQMTNRGRGCCAPGGVGRRVGLPPGPAVISCGASIGRAAAAVPGPGEGRGRGGVEDGGRRGHGDVLSVRPPGDE